MIIGAVMICAAFGPPGQDPFTMVVLSACLLLLIEIAFQFCRVHDKRQNRERPAWMDLDDESASALDEGPTGVGGPAPVDAPSGVYASPKPAAPSASSQMVRGEKGASDSASQQAEYRKGPHRPTDAGGFFDDVL